ncbi:hypothetical protein LWI28_019777 [Acer negundo]|uniref:Fibronectin type III-like domain-containing protein n=1 Tax=Acer negundo TaxID=4023 RepID=A0AAD5JGU9_ACENE|nr:hypothetical protein LWI28_019777 [Acer negundo]
MLVEDLKCDQHFEVGIEVQNVGKRGGSEVVIVYSKPPEGIAATYIKQVIGFKRVFVAAGGSEKVTFSFNACQSLKVIDYAANSLLPSGGHTIAIGDSGLSFPVHVEFDR